jgi:hypothetical protein
MLHRAAFGCCVVVAIIFLWKYYLILNKHPKEINCTERNHNKSKHFVDKKSFLYSPLNDAIFIEEQVDENTIKVTEFSLLI